MKPILSLTALFLSSFAACAAPELPPTLDARELAPPELLAGPGWSVEPRVPTDGFYGLFAIRSAYGLVTARGVDQLRVRGHEQRALDQLAGLGRRQATMEGARGSAQQTLDAARQTASDPLGTVAAVPEGVGRLFTRLGRGVEDRAAKATGAASTANDKKTRAGVAKARRELARKLDVDPYTDNPLLSPRMDEVARAMAHGAAAVSIFTGAASMWVGAAARTANLVWNQPPEDVRANSAKRLKAAGVADATAKRFLDNPAFTPTSQSLLIESFDALAPVSGREVLVQLAGQMRSRDEVRYLNTAARLLIALRQAGEKLARVETRGDVPVAVTADGTVLAPVPVDYLSWSDTLDRHFTPAQTAVGKRELVLTGGISPLAKSEIEKRGWAIRKWTGTY